MPWVRNLPSFKPWTTPPHFYEDLTVSHLMNPGSLSWDHTIVRLLFTHTDANAILSTPLYSRPADDSCVWSATTNGFYRVKSAYIICINLIHASEPPNSSHCKLLWTLKVPPWVCAFLWQTTHQCLPTRVNLSTRGIPCTKSCVSCDLLAKSHMHIFFICSKSIECWDRLGIDNIIRELLTRASNFSIMMFELFTRLKE